MKLMTNKKKKKRSEREKLKNQLKCRSNLKENKL